VNSQNVFVAERCRAIKKAKNTGAKGGQEWVKEFLWGASDHRKATPGGVEGSRSAQINGKRVKKGAPAEGKRREEIHGGPGEGEG